MSTDIDLTTPDWSPALRYNDHLNQVVRRYESAKEVLDNERQASRLSQEYRHELVKIIGEDNFRALRERQDLLTRRYRCSLPEGLYSERDIKNEQDLRRKLYEEMRQFRANLGIDDDKMDKIGLLRKYITEKFKSSLEAPEHPQANIVSEKKFAYSAPWSVVIRPPYLGSGVDATEPPEIPYQKSYTSSAYADPSTGYFALRSRAHVQDPGDSLYAEIRTMAEVYFVVQAGASGHPKVRVSIKNVYSLYAGDFKNLPVGWFDTSEGYVKSDAFVQAGYTPMGAPIGSSVTQVVGTHYIHSKLFTQAGNWWYYPNLIPAGGLVITTNDLGGYGYTVAQGGYYTFFARVTTRVQISANDIEASGDVSEAWDITEVRVSV